jgi:hypothetical protein
MCRWQHRFWHMNMGCCKKYCILTPTYKQKFAWPCFKQIDLIFPALVFAYELQSPSKVCKTNSYVNLEICMTILQTASLCCWQHLFLAYEHGYLWMYLIPIPTYNHKFVWPYFKQIHLIFPALVFAYELQSPSNISNTNFYVNLGICMTILQTASLCC